MPDNYFQSVVKDREATLQKLGSLLFYMFVAVCCITHTASESTAGNEPPRETWRRVDETVIYPSNAPTKVTVVGNSVLVPVTLAYQGNQLDVRLLLDTGAAGTFINTDIADRLHINLSTARRAQAQVLGGTFIEASQVTLSRIKVGPHTRQNAVAFVIREQGPVVKRDGLLGLDLLRGFKYHVDFEKQLILWE